MNRRHVLTPADSIISMSYPADRRCDPTPNDRLVKHLERAGFVVAKRPPGVSGAAAFTADDAPKAAVQYSMDEHVERDL